LPVDWESEKTFLSGIEMPPAIIVSLFLNRSLEHNVWTHFMPLEHKGPVSFCVDSQQKNSGNTPSGKATLQAWINNPSSKALINSSDAEIANIAVKDVTRIMPQIADWIEASHVTRHPIGVPQSSVGHNARAADFLKRMDQRKGISFCGDYFSGGYVECALWSVDRAVSQITVV